MIAALECMGSHMLTQPGFTASKLIQALTQCQPEKYHCLDTVDAGMEVCGC